MIDVWQDNPTEVTVQQLYGLPVDTTVAFSNNEGLYDSRIEKRQRYLLKKLAFLAPFLDAHEKILFVTTSCSPTSFVEQMLTGAILHPLKRCMFAVTGKRILHVPATQALNYRYSVSQISYVDCTRIRIRGSTLTARYKSGRSEKFSCLSLCDRKKLKTLLKTVLFDGRANPALERVHLCPRCTNPLIRNYYGCPHCSLTFKNKAWATLLSVLLPGGGYFYTRHPIVGLLAGAMEMAFAFLLVAALDLLWITFPNVPQGLYQATFICATILVFEKLSTILFSNKCIEQFVPQQRHVEVFTQQGLSEHSAPKFDESLATGWRSV